MKLIILDRDGVINHDSDQFIKSPEEWQPIDGSMDSGIWFCPHSADHNCDCRKPKAGMILDILDRFQAQASETYLVGDSLRDLQAIETAGGKAILVKTGKGMKTLATDGDKLPADTQIFDSLLAFAQHLVKPNQPSHLDAS